MGRGVGAQAGMEESLPIPPISPPSEAKAKSSSKGKKPDPAELIALYEAEGLNPSEAAHKAIQDLQSVLSNVVARSRSYPMRTDRFLQESSLKLDDINARLSVLEMKVDTKPGMAETLAIGISAGALIQATPHIFRAFSHIWRSIRNSTK